MKRWQMTGVLGGLACAAALLAPVMGHRAPETTLPENPSTEQAQTPLSGCHWPDGDNDGYGDGRKRCIRAEQAPQGYVSDRNDCDDTRPHIHPGALDIPGDSFDQDCDGSDAIPFSQRIPLIPRQ